MESKLPSNDDIYKNNTEKDSAYEEYFFARKLKIKWLLEDFGKQLKMARKRKGMTQGELADILRTKQGNISQLESGKRNISLAQIVIIMEAIGKVFKIEIR